MGLGVGTCGYSYKEWVGPFYPPGLTPGRFLEFYASVFGTVELNATFYRLPPLKALAGMARRVPESFAFVVKAHQDLTHGRGRAAEATLPLFQAALKPFQDAGKLGAVLLQFPFAFQPSPDNLDHVAGLAGRITAAPLVVEFRHRDWFSSEALGWLKARRLSLCCVDEPDLPGLPPPMAVVTGPVGYVRFHGRNAAQWWGPRDRPAGARYDYLYAEEELGPWANKVAAMLRETSSVYAFFNNHPGGKAALNAKTFAGLTAGAEPARGGPFHDPPSSSA